MIPDSRECHFEWNVSKFMWLPAVSWFYCMSITFCTKSMFTNKKFRFIFCVTESRIFTILLFFFSSFLHSFHRIPSAYRSSISWTSWVLLFFFMFVSLSPRTFFFVFVPKCCWFRISVVFLRNVHDKLSLLGIFPYLCHGYIPLYIIILLGCRVLDSTSNSIPSSHVCLYFLFLVSLCECLVSSE